MVRWINELMPTPRSALAALFVTLTVPVTCAPSRPPPSPTPAAHDAVEQPSAAREVAPIDAGDASEATRPTSIVFTPPDPLPAPGPPTPASATCRNTPERDQAYEDERRAAAVDAALRAQAFVPLSVTREVELASSAAGNRPALYRGSHWLVVAPPSCAALPTVAMTSSHEVFVATPVLVATRLRVVRECVNACGNPGCGTRPRAPVVALVPADAVLGAPRDVRVPIDTEVELESVKRRRCPRAH